MTDEEYASYHQMMKQRDMLAKVLAETLECPPDCKNTMPECWSITECPTPECWLEWAADTTRMQPSPKPGNGSPKKKRAKL